MKRHSLVGLHSDGFEVISIAVDAFSFSGLKSTLKERGILQNYTFIAYQSAHFLIDSNNITKNNHFDYAYFHILFVLA
ncbi:hypothetical protein T4D_3109 [Trichinella pseudospiralis]|uniref:Uncharacterized protein n=1 Tax=Trichinella pseudospiralis TaxID=6337 RepID=A0A0V1G5Y9_TRIPS|nr:hypothetical protein T4D_3109 [Trichinella pseudospiralis]